MSGTLSAYHTPNPALTGVSLPCSEFGIPSYPDVKTIDYWLDGDTKQRWAQSKLMAQHDRAGAHERRFAIVMNENLRLTSDLET